MMAMLLPIYLLIQVMPPPLGQLTVTLILGSAQGGIDYSAPADCGCGVPARPRGPRWPCHSQPKKVISFIRPVPHA